MSDAHSLQDGATASAEDGEELGLTDLLVALGQGKAALLKLGGVGLLVGVAAALLIKPTFTATTVILPPQQQQSSAAAALANLGALAGLAGSAAGLKSPDEMYVAFLGSERIENSLIDRFKLKDRYEQKYSVDTRKVLEAHVRVNANKKSGFISIAADDHDPVFAAQLANAYVDELGKLLGTLAVSDAQQRRQFFEQQVDKTKEQLASDEARFKAAQQQSGFQVTQALAETGVRASVELRTQIATREVQLQALRGTYATAQNPDVVRLSSELSALRAQLARQEGGSDVANSSNSSGKSVEQDAVRAYRDVKVHEAMLEVLIRQYELARVDEAREGPLLQQVDVATPPEKKSKPSRALLVGGGLVAGLMIGALWVLAQFLLGASGEAQAQWQSVRRAWRWRN